MGGNASNLVPQPIGFDYMSITFRANDRIRLLYANDHEISLVREAILQFWRKGIQEEMAKFGSAHEFKLNGNPFCGVSSAENSIMARKLACNMLFRLYNGGCKLLVSSDLSRVSDLTTWFFHREQTEMSQFNFACIGVSSCDKLKFVNFPSTMIEALQNTVQQAWPRGIQKVKMIEESLEIKLSGNPWSQCSSADAIQSRTLIKALINDLNRMQWSLYGSSNLKSTADTLFFKYEPTMPADGSLATGFVLSLNRNDRLRCIDAPLEVTNCVKSAIVESWCRGLQDEKPKFNCIEFKLSGNPWFASGTEAVDSRLLICKILEKLTTIGWKVQIAIDLSRKVNDKSVLTFQRCAPISLPVFCLSLNESDKVRFINAPQNVIDTLRATIAGVWAFGISREAPYGLGFEMKLNGNPWTYGMNGHDGAHGRIMLCHLIKACAQIGWYLILSADVSSKYIHQEDGPDYPIDVHSLWFTWYGQPSTAPVQPQFTPAEAYAPTQFGMLNQERTQFGTGGAPVSGFSYAPPTYDQVFQK